MTATTDALSEELSAEPDPVYLWLSERFEKIGFAEDDADLLAAEQADWRLAERMIEHGCPPATLLHILT